MDVANHRYHPPARGRTLERIDSHAGIVGVQRPEPLIEEESVKATASSRSQVDHAESKSEGSQEALTSRERSSRSRLAGDLIEDCEAFGKRVAVPAHLAEPVPSRCEQCLGPQGQRFANETAVPQQVRELFEVVYEFGAATEMFVERPCPLEIGFSPLEPFGCHERFCGGLRRFSVKRVKIGYASFLKNTGDGIRCILVQRGRTPLLPIPTRSEAQAPGL